jgi:hypothetical protein
MSQFVQTKLDNGYNASWRREGNYAAVAITPDGFVKLFLLFFLFLLALNREQATDYASRKRFCTM